LVLNLANFLSHENLQKKKRDVKVLSIMAQKSNILTIRTPEKFLNLRTTNTKEVLNLLKLAKIITQSLRKKGIINMQLTLNVKGANCYLNFKLFFMTHKLNRYKKFLKKTENSQLLSKSLRSAIHHNLKYRLVINQLFVLNKYVQLQKSRVLFDLLKKFQNKIFSRRFSLFIDFLKLTPLFSNRTIDTTNFLKILTLIFSRLSKTRHQNFIVFVEKILWYLVHKDNNDIEGAKFLISGKLKGKLRASSKRIVIGKVANQSINSDIEYSQQHGYTVYGTFGLKL